MKMFSMNVISVLFIEHNNLYRFLDLATYVKLRRYESFSLKEAMMGLKISDFTWVKSPSQCSKNSKNPSSHVPLSESLYQKKLVEKWITWVFTHFIIPILQWNFYITENGLHKNRIFYYRRSVWAKIRKLAISEMKSTLFEVVPQEKALLTLKQRAFGFSYLRILPKSINIRPILNFGRKPKPIKGLIEQNNNYNKNFNKFDKSQSSINTILQNTFHIMTYEKVRIFQEISIYLYRVS